MALVQQVNIAAVSTIVLRALHFLSCWGYVFLMKANFVDKYVVPDQQSFHGLRYVVELQENHWHTFQT